MCSSRNIPRNPSFLHAKTVKVLQICDIWTYKTIQPSSFSVQPFFHFFKTEIFVPETVFKLAPNRKRIHTAVDSSGDEEPPVKGELTVKEKEQRLIAVKKAMPQCDTMVTFRTLYTLCEETKNCVSHLAMPGCPCAKQLGRWCYNWFHRRKIGQETSHWHRHICSRPDDYAECVANRD